MFLPLRSRVSLLAGLCLLLVPALSWAQCPAAAACTPGKATSTLAATYHMGIYHVKLGSINTSTSDYTDGYQDYSCAPTGATSLTVSAPTDISIQNGTAAPENVRVWIDYNNDGAFDTAELAFSSDNKTLHTGSIVPPSSATLGVALRMRVASDYANSPVPTACSTPQYSQDEDYSVTLTPNTSPPTAAFTPSISTTCSGSVQFLDQSENAPTSWRWDFGDNTTSSLQNPLHTYATVGTYQVTLTATNAAGSSSSAATAITYTTSVPVAASCAGLPATAHCCSYGITRVQLNTIDNASADGSAGYQDFTCPQRTALMVGRKYTFSITTGGSNTHDTRAWLDLNNDGVFSAAEKVAEALNTASPTLSLTVPGTATLNQPLRLRIVADGTGTDPQPCTAPSLGQVEDYTVTAVPNTAPPVAAFTSDYVAGACTTDNVFTFTDQSTNSPTAWFWTVSPGTGVAFVHGTTAASQNPQLAFAASGYYTVTLTATNANGSTTVSTPAALLIQVPCLAYCASTGGYPNGSSSLWITNVSVSAAPAGGPAFSSSSANSPGGYTFFADQSIDLQAGATQTISITTNRTYLHHTAIWIDFNHDGVFANTKGAGGELVYNAITTGAVSSVTVAVPGTIGTTRLRVTVNSNSNTPNACATYQGEAEVEDYPVNAGVLGTRPSQALPALTISPNPTPDGDLHLQVSEASASGRYSVVVENMLGAQLLSQVVRLSPDAPATLRLTALPAGLYLVRLTNELGETALRRIVRQ